MWKTKGVESMKETTEQSTKKNAVKCENGFGCL